MAAGDVDVSIVENPTATTMKTAMDAMITATNTTARFSLVNLGQHIMIVGVAQA